MSTFLHRIIVGIALGGLVATSAGLACAHEATRLTVGSITGPLSNPIIWNLLKSQRKRRGEYSAESGTVSDKLGFCQRALHHLEKFSDLSPQAKEITKRIYEFIREHNQ